MTSLQDLSLEQQVAQRFMVGFSGPLVPEDFSRWIDAGVGGVIFFRENFQSISHYDTVGLGHQIKDLMDRFPEGCLPFTCLDQEGGRVERLPYTLFPSMPSPRALSLAHHNDNNTLAAESLDMLAYYLSLLGFNMNCIPCLDVNLNPDNPIIGPRSFSEDAERVWRFGKVAIDRFQTRNLVSVAKHFPGHGNGTADSHDSLPELKFTDEELSAFQQAIDFDVPVVMMAHGLYKELDAENPASLSQKIIGDVLRSKCGFNGVVMTDDLCMGAVNGNAVETAIKAIEAGNDMLLYRSSDDSQWAVYQTVVEKLKAGELNMDAHQKAVERIDAVKSKLTPYQPNDAIINTVMPQRGLEAVSSLLAEKTMTVLSGDVDEVFPFDPEEPIFMIYPKRDGITGYEGDVETSDDFMELLADEGCVYPGIAAYPVDELIKIDVDMPDQVVFCSYDAHRYTKQQDIFQNILDKSTDEARIVVVGLGGPDDKGCFDGADLYLYMGSYRPAAMLALVQRFFLEPEPPKQNHQQQGNRR